MEYLLIYQRLINVSYSSKKVFSIFWLIAFSILCNSIGSAQEVSTGELNKISSFEDQRDGKSYEIVLIDTLWWFNQNLNYHTPDSYCFDNKEENCANHGRLYSFKESRKACPEGWRLPEKSEVAMLFEGLGKREDPNLVYLNNTWEDINDNPLKFHFQKTGFKNRKKYKSFNSFNLWLGDQVYASHLHMYVLKDKSYQEKPMVIFLHDHESHNSIVKKRKLGIRCISSLIKT